MRYHFYSLSTYSFPNVQKIGKAENIKTRVSQLQTGNYEKLNINWSFSVEVKDDSDMTEIDTSLKYLLMNFRNIGGEGGTEWYEKNAEIDEQIKNVIKKLIFEKTGRNAKCYVEKYQY